jgi:outer membrane protein assembly factor BamD (BamD/ComL family)
MGAAPPARARTLAEETKLLLAAHGALEKGDAAGALEQIDRLGALYPEGALAEERRAARVLALCAAGRREEARREAERFLAEEPRSIQAARLRASCAFAKAGEGGTR